MRIFLLVMFVLPLAVGCGAGDEEKPGVDADEDAGAEADDGAADDADADADADDGAAADADADADADAADADADDADCGSAHSMVGWVADMPPGSHDTSGTATIIDDCTVRVTNFNFDGGGVVVQFYGGTGGDYGSGFALSEDIFGTAFSDETVTLTLPEGKTFDDLDGISVWCVEFSVSFTDAMFEAP